MDSTIYQHMSRVKVLTRVLWRIKDIRKDAFEMDPRTQTVLKHSGDANKIYKLKLPINVETAKLNAKMTKYFKVHVFQNKFAWRIRGSVSVMSTHGA